MLLSPYIFKMFSFFPKISYYCLHYYTLVELLDYNFHLLFPEKTFVSLPDFSTPKNKTFPSVYFPDIFSTSSHTSNPCNSFFIYT